MAKIPGAALVMIGGIVALVSLFIDGMILFVPVGGCIALWGAIKIYIGPTKTRHVQEIAIRCPRCQRQVKENFNYCWYCGNPLKNQGGYPHLNKGSHHQHTHGNKY